MPVFLATNWFTADVNFGCISLLQSQSITLKATEGRKGPGKGRKRCVGKRDERHRKRKQERDRETNTCDTGKKRVFAQPHSPSWPH